MKTPILKPGFEFIFALSLMVILGLPPMLMAQDKKDVEIKIENGDTTVNGKNIKDLSPEERKMALRDIKHISADEMSTSGKGRLLMIQRDDSVGHRRMKQDMIIRDDSLGHPMGMRGNRRPGRMNNGLTNQKSMDDRMLMMERNNNNAMMGMMTEMRNSQSFHYINTDNTGIATHLSFHISEVNNEDLKRMPHIEGARLTLTDLNIVPEFAAGKILLMFTLPSKGLAEVKLVNSQGDILWTEKAGGGSFSKAFVMGLNGVYYLEVKQGAGIALKKILKDE